MRRRTPLSSLAAGLTAPQFGATGSRDLDATVPDVVEQVRRNVVRLSALSFELIKHHYSSYDILGRWRFADCSRAIRDAAGPAFIIGRDTAECDWYGATGGTPFPRCTP